MILRGALEFSRVTEIEGGHRKLVEALGVLARERLENELVDHDVIDTLSLLVEQEEIQRDQG
uniref:Uncharacterized protein n=1 Tax=Bosea sp. NBC_00436 TaxID=2969620 RepID=A0A9E7ZMN3_9HYPH